MRFPKTNSPDTSTLGQAVDIVADDRERASGVIAFLSSTPEISVRIERLSSGYRPKGKKGRQIHLLQGLPGVGRDRALRLLEKYGSAEAVMCAGRQELLTVEGIGTKTANRIYWVVCGKLETF